MKRCGLGVLLATVVVALFPAPAMAGSERAVEVHVPVGPYDGTGPCAFTVVITNNSRSVDYINVQVYRTGQTPTNTNHVVARGQTANAYLSDPIDDLSQVTIFVTGYAQGKQGDRVIDRDEFNNLTIDC